MVAQLSVDSYTQRNVSQRLPEAETVARIVGKDLRVKSKVEIIKAVVLNQGRFWSPGNTGQCLKTFSVVTTQGCVADTGWWVKTRDAGRHPTKHRTAPHNKVSQPTLARAPRPRIPKLKMKSSAGANIRNVCASKENCRKYSDVTRQRANNPICTHQNILANTVANKH